MLRCRFVGSRGSKSAVFRNMRTMVLTNSLSVSMVVLGLLPVALGGCGGASERMVVFRDLADIPERPAVTAREMNDQALEALKEDRARTAQAAEDLRSEPFAPPEPAPMSPNP